MEDRRENKLSHFWKLIRGNFYYDMVRHVAGLVATSSAGAWSYMHRFFGYAWEIFGILCVVLTIYFLFQAVRDGLKIQIERENRRQKAQATIQAQWAKLNEAEKSLVRFVLLNHTASVPQIFTHMDKEGYSQPMNVLKSVQTQTTFILGRLGDPKQETFSINPEFKPVLEQLSLS
jgi:predicted metalloprotease